MERRRLCVFGNKISDTVEYMEKSGLQFQSILGSGSFGCVVKMKNFKDKSKVAVKIVGKQPVVGEIDIWRRLDHTNILKLISAKYISSVDSFIFVTPVLSTTLKEKLSQKSNSIKLYVAIRWLKNTSDAFWYLHNQKLWYLDLKADNILISDRQKAVLCDFGFMTVGDKPVNNYGSPRLYGPPEASIRGTGWMVNGYSFDVWRIGMLALEMFTRMGLLTEAYKWPSPLSDWICIVYPMVQRILVKEKFFKLMKRG